jgi:hypothetical protein
VAFGQKVVERQVTQRAEFAPHALCSRLSRFGLPMRTRHKFAKKWMADWHIRADPTEAAANLAHAVP